MHRPRPSCCMAQAMAQAATPSGATALAGAENRAALRCRAALSTQHTARLL